MANIFSIWNTVNVITSVTTCLTHLLFVVEKVKYTKSHCNKNWNAYSHHNATMFEFPVAECEVRHDDHANHQTDGEASEDTEDLDVRQRADDEEEGEGEEDLEEAKAGIRQQRPRLLQLDARYSQQARHRSLRSVVRSVWCHHARHLRSND